MRTSAITWAPLAANELRTRCRGNTRRHDCSPLTTTSLEKTNEEVSAGLLRHRGARLGHRGHGPGCQLHGEAWRHAVSECLEGTRPAASRAGASRWILFVPAGR